MAGPNNPCCPNHGVELNRTGSPGRGICPISGCLFTFDEQLREMETFIGPGGELCQRPKVTALGGEEG